MSEVSVDDCPVAITIEVAEKAGILPPMSTTNTGVHAEEAHARSQEHHGEGHSPGHQESLPTDDQGGKVNKQPTPAVSGHQE